MALSGWARIYSVVVIACLLFGTASAVLGGEPFMREQIKFVAFIDVSFYTSYCSAVIVTPSHTVSSALCQGEPQLPVPAVAYAGSNRYIEPGDFLPPVQGRTVDEWIFYDLDQQIMYDVSIQRLTTPWLFNEYIAAIPLATEPALPEKFKRSCRVFGFGYGSRNESDSGIGRSAPQTVTSWRGCLKEREEHVMCTEESRVCSGDVGGPLICADDRGRNRLFAIAAAGPLSASDERCTPDEPTGSYAYVGFYYQWFLKNTNTTEAKAEANVIPQAGDAVVLPAANNIVPPPESKNL